MLTFFFLSFVSYQESRYSISDAAIQNEEMELNTYFNNKVNIPHDQFGDVSL